MVFCVLRGDRSEHLDDQGAAFDEPGGSSTPFFRHFFAHVSPNIRFGDVLALFF